MADKLHFIAIDDEPIALAIIEKFSQDQDRWQLDKVFSNAVEATEYINNNKIDLVITDINMPDVNGINFVQNLSSQPRPLIIFLTAYKDYAVTGFDLEVIDYLVKPVSLSRFNTALERCYERCQLLNGDQANQLPDHIYVHSEYNQVKIVIQEIMYIEAMGDYIKIFLKDKNKPILTLERIKIMEQKLEAYGIKRIHRSYLINPEYITAKLKSKVQMKDVWLPIGESYGDVDL